MILVLELEVLKRSVRFVLNVKSMAIRLILVIEFMGILLDISPNISLNLSILRLILPQLLPLSIMQSIMTVLQSLKMEISFSH